MTVVGGLAQIGTGRVAVIAPPARVAETAATLDLAPGPDLDAPMAVLTPALVRARGRAQAMRASSPGPAPDPVLVGPILFLWQK